MANQQLHTIGSYLGMDCRATRFQLRVEKHRIACVDRFQHFARTQVFERIQDAYQRFRWLQTAVVKKHAGGANY